MVRLYPEPISTRFSRMIGQPFSPPSPSTFSRSPPALIRYIAEKMKVTFKKIEIIRSMEKLLTKQLAKNSAPQ